MKNTVLYVSHGAGPLPVLGDAGHDEMLTNLKSLAEKIDRPEAVVVISAHWEEKQPTVLGAENPSLYYDYYGFQQEAYQIEYPAAGEPALAKSICKALDEAGMDSISDNERGFDHGLFIPLKIMFPDADIPCTQLSLIKGLDPRKHIALGNALAKLDYENLLILGSGFSFHNMKAFFTPDTPETKSANQSFEKWLIETCSNNEINEQERQKRFEQWQSAPSARYCHPREEHLLPLLVCYGAAGRCCSEYYELNIFGKKCSTYLWEQGS